MSKIPSDFKTWLNEDSSGGSTLMRPQLGWTMIKGIREMRRYEKDNYIHTHSVPKSFPCFVMCAQDGNEDSIAIILEVSHLCAMLGASK